MIFSDTPNYPWQRVGCDLFKWKSNTYLLLIDYFSRYIEIALLQSGSRASDVIMHMQSLFARHGIPKILVSDNGSPFNSYAFADFVQTYGFSHTTSSPYFPQGNGKAERGVQEKQKEVFKLQNDFCNQTLTLIWRCSVIGRHP